jgi:hypothetical protein
MATKEKVEELAKDSSIFKRREYGIWKGLIEICHDESHPKYKQYGGLGIVVCQLWREKKGSRGYLHFIGDMGFAPDTTSVIRRSNVNDDYKPSNCSWTGKGWDYVRNSRGYISVTLSNTGIFNYKK